MSDFIRQTLVLIPALVLMLGVFWWLARHDMRARQFWSEIALANDFSPAQGNNFSAEEARFLLNTKFGTLGPKELFSIGGSQPTDGLQIKALQLSRRWKGGKCETWFRYSSAHGDTSVREFGMALLVLPGLDTVSPFLWRLGRSGKIERIGKITVLDGIDWSILRGHADGGWLAGAEAGPAGVICWITAPRVSSSQLILDLTREMLDSIGVEAPG